MAMREYAVYDVAMRPGHDDWITEKERYISTSNLQPIDLDTAGNVVQIASRRVGRRQDGELGRNLTDPSSQEIHTADTLSPTLSNFNRRGFF